MKQTNENESLSESNLRLWGGGTHCPCSMYVVVVPESQYISSFVVQ